MGLIRFPEHWDAATRIGYLQRKILLNSRMYYVHGECPLPDWYYDEMSKQLVCEQKDFDGDIRDTEYGYVFYDYEGSTGYYLFSRLTEYDKKHLMKITQTYLNNNILPRWR